MPLNWGSISFAELTSDPLTGQKISPAQRLSDLIESIELADQVGLDVFGLGEHHRPDFCLVDTSCGTGGHRSAHQTYSSLNRRYGAQLGRSSAGVSRLRHA